MDKETIVELVSINPGGIAELADETLWRIALGHRERAIGWGFGTRLSLEPQPDNDLWPQKLVEVVTGIEVSVIRSGLLGEWMTIRR